MALKKTTEIEKNLYEIEFDVDKQTFEAAIEKVYRKEVKKINVPGFRKGKAPRSMIERMYGKGVFYEDAINEIIPDAYAEAIKEAALEVVSRPEFDIVTIDDNGVVLKAKFYVKPEVSIEGYKGIEVEKTVKVVTDEDVTAEIDKARQRASRVIEITDRAVQNGDIVNIDYEGFCGGVAFDGGKAENYDLTIGSGSFIPGFEEQIIGHTIGESFDITVNFPEQYHSEDLAGKEAIFKITLHGIKFNQLPELDDEFVKDVSEFDTVDEYVADVRATLEKRNEQEADRMVENQLLDKLVELLVAEIPAPMFEAEAENILREYDNNFRMQGLDLNTYCQYTGQTLDDLRQQFMPAAEKRVKTRLALEKIVELESIDATEEEVEAEFARLAAAYGLEIEKVKSFVESDAIKLDLCVKKAVDLIKASAVIKA